MGSKKTPEGKEKKGRGNKIRKRRTDLAVW